MATLFARLLGNDFERLPPRVRELHACETTQTYVGRADVERGSGLLVALHVRRYATSCATGQINTSHVTIEPTSHDRTLDAQVRRTTRCRHACGMPMDC